ncbi:hypothetical protein B0H14DRAFT_3461601 [Mycena olivaceomarginata]|nr:hypothetical protein B0H14DRAFT_3461601 [Mycena olivaceomarginata]
MHLLATTLLSLLVPATPAFAANEPETNAKHLALGLPPLLAVPPSWYARSAAYMERAILTYHFPILQLLNDLPPSFFVTNAKGKLYRTGPSADTSGHVQGPSARTTAHTASTTA